MSASGIAYQAWRKEDGQTIILTALCLAVLMGVLALAVDVGLLFCAKQTAQTAADAGAIAAAREMAFGDAIAAARADATSNGYTDGQHNVTVAVNNPPQFGPHSSDGSYVEVIVSTQNPSYFLNVFNRHSMTVQARAVAKLVSTNNCVYALSPTGTNFNLSNGVAVNFPGCALYGNSSSSSALSVVGGASLTDAATNLVGGYVQNNGGQIATTPNTGVGYVSDPLSYLQPPTYSASSCLPDPVTTYTGWVPTVTGNPNGLSTVCYNNLTINNGHNGTLNPGVYIINGTLTIGGGATVTGTGVTFYLPPGAKLQFDNGITLNLKAPTSGAYNGILFYQDRNNTNAEMFEGGANSSLEGILYFPSSNMTFENGTNTTTYATIIASTLTFAGGAHVQNYALKNSGTPISSPRLVE